jgi:hypothetical protein
MIKMTFLNERVTEAKVAVRTKEEAKEPVC